MLAAATTLAPLCGWFAEGFAATDPSDANALRSELKRPAWQRLRKR